MRRAKGPFLLLAILASAPAQATDDDATIARDLAEMLRAGRSVISNNQARINDPNLDDKGLGGQQVLQQAVAIYREATGQDPSTIDPSTRRGRLLQAEMAAISEVMDSNQSTINQPGVGFKAFIPAVFGRLVSEAFNKRAPGEAEMKVTAPRELVRNRRARPDAWENEVIVQHFQAPNWPKGQPYTAMVTTGGRSSFRIMVPEYYAASCLSCHGGKKGEMDITGYPKEGAKEGDLGGVISFVLFQ